MWMDSVVVLKSAKNVENAKLFSESDQRNAELALLSSVQQGLAGEMSLQDIYGMVGDRLQDMFDAQIVGINTFDLEADLQVPRLFPEQFQSILENILKILLSE